MKHLAQTVTNPFGTVATPQAIQHFQPVESGGLGQLLNLVLNLLVVAGGIYALFNFILAGYAFLSAGDDPKKVESAWGKIWQTAIGLVFIAGSLLLAAIFGWLIFGSPSYLISPSIPTI